MTDRALTIAIAVVGIGAVVGMCAGVVADKVSPPHVVTRYVLSATSADHRIDSATPPYLIIEVEHDELLKIVREGLERRGHKLPASAMSFEHYLAVATATLASEEPLPIRHFWVFKIDLKDK